jgi:phosphatidylglycerophosphate synthase
MFDGVARKLIDPALTKAGAWAAAQGFRANQATLAGLALGALAAAIIAAGAHTAWALVPLLANRILDGLDGAIARAKGKTDFGGFLDIVADFAFYGLIPFAFALRDEIKELGLQDAYLTVYRDASKLSGTEAEELLRE